jgi:hypothetical protein
MNVLPKEPSDPRIQIYMRRITFTDLGVTEWCVQKVPVLSCLDTASIKNYGTSDYGDTFSQHQRKKGSDRVLLRRIREASKEGQDPSNRCEMIKHPAQLFVSTSTTSPFAHLEAQLLSQQRASFHFHICLQFIFVSARLHHHVGISLLLRLRLVQSSLQFFLH